jgi:hypothetical protein
MVRKKQIKRTNKHKQANKHSNFYFNHFSFLLFCFQIGTKIKSKYSGDGEYYEAFVRDFQHGKNKINESTLTQTHTQM